MTPSLLDRHLKMKVCILKPHKERQPIFNKTRRVQKITQVFPAVKSVLSMMPVFEDDENELESEAEDELEHAYRNNQNGN